MVNNRNGLTIESYIRKFSGYGPDVSKLIIYWIDYDEINFFPVGEKILIE